jgi:hypothetical protein
MKSNDGKRFIFANKFSLLDILPHKTIAVPRVLSRLFPNLLECVENNESSELSAQKKAYCSTFHCQRVFVAKFAPSGINPFASIIP